MTIITLLPRNERRQMQKITNKIPDEIMPDGLIVDNYIVHKRSSLQDD